MLLVIAFALGAIVSAFFQRALGIRTIWLAIILLGTINTIYLFKLRHIYTADKADVSK